MKDPLIFNALGPFIQTLDELKISYQLVGSVASSAYGIASMDRIQWKLICPSI
jgi:hypothetical protein